MMLGANALGWAFLGQGYAGPTGVVPVTPTTPALTVAFDANIPALRSFDANAPAQRGFDANTPSQKGSS